MTDAQILNGAGVTVTLAGQSFAIAAPVRRVSRQWLAEIVRIGGLLQGLQMPENGAEPTPDIAAAMFDVFEPICTFLGRCSSEIAEHPTALDEATEQELVQALMAIKDMIERPFVQPRPNAPNTTPPANAIQRSNTSDEAIQTSTGSPASTS